MTNMHYNDDHWKTITIVHHVMIPDRALSV
jgi:hypothetical protein